MTTETSLLVVSSIDIYRIVPSNWIYTSLYVGVFSYMLKSLNVNDLRAISRINIFLKADSTSMFLWWRWWYSNIYKFMTKILLILKVIIIVLIFVVSSAVICLLPNTQWASDVNYTGNWHQLMSVLFLVNIRCPLCDTVAPRCICNVPSFPCICKSLALTPPDYCWFGGHIFSCDSMII